MLVTLLKAKIHNATVIDTNLNYEGSCAISEALMEKLGIVEYEQLHICNKTNGKRFITYAIKYDSPESFVTLNGACARLAEPGDKVIICTYGLYSNTEEYAPNIATFGD